jgi:putative transposase
MYRKTALASGETYHIYNRGAHKQKIFTEPRDYARFKLLLHFANNGEPIHLSNILRKYQGRSLLQSFQEEPTTDHSLVDIFAYALMPNHFHLMLRQKVDNGITTFLKKVMTGYSMYFNTKYEHSGVLFQGRFKSSHVSDDAYLRYLFAYIHLNPLELMGSDVRRVGKMSSEKADTFLSGYDYSSYPDYLERGNRPEKILLSQGAALELLGNKLSHVSDLCGWVEKYQGPSLPT